MQQQEVVGTLLQGDALAAKNLPAQHHQSRAVDFPVVVAHAHHHHPKHPLGDHRVVRQGVENLAQGIQRRSGRADGTALEEVLQKLHRLQQFLLG